MKIQFIILYAVLMILVDKVANCKKVERKRNQTRAKANMNKEQIISYLNKKENINDFSSIPYYEEITLPILIIVNTFIANNQNIAEIDVNDKTKELKNFTFNAIIEKLKELYDFLDKRLKQTEDASTIMQINKIKAKNFYFVSLLLSAYQENIKKIIQCELQQLEFLSLNVENLLLDPTDDTKKIMEAVNLLTKKHVLSHETKKKDLYKKLHDFISINLKRKIVDLSKNLKDLHALGLSDDQIEISQVLSDRLNSKSFKEIQRVFIIFKMQNIFRIGIVNFFKNSLSSFSFNPTEVDQSWKTPIENKECKSNLDDQINKSDLDSLNIEKISKVKKISSKQGLVYTFAEYAVISYSFASTLIAVKMALDGGITGLIVGSLINLFVGISTIAAGSLVFIIYLLFKSD